MLTVSALSQPTLELERFPVARMRTLLTNLFHEVACSGCTEAKNVLFRPFLDMDDEGMEENFFDAAQKIYTFVYFPSSLQDKAPCPPDQKNLQNICELFRQTFPYSPLSSLLSFVGRNPVEVRFEMIEKAEKADEEEKLANTSRVLAMLYLNSTALLFQSNPGAEDASNLPGRVEMKGLKDLPAIIARIEQRQEIELMRLQYVLELFRRFEQKRSHFGAAAMGAGVGVAVSVVTGPGIIFGAGITAASTVAAVKTSQLLKRVLTRSPPEGISYTKLSEDVSYGFSNCASGLKRWRKSATFGYVRFFFTDKKEEGEMHYSEFHLHDKEHILPQAFGELYEHMRDALDSGVLSTTRLLAILHTLKTSSLASDEPKRKMIEPKTEVFLLSLLLAHLRASLSNKTREELAPVCVQLREMVLKNISENEQLRKTTEERLKAIIQDTEVKV